MAGTDDYMTKPVDEEEMVLRIRALLRRAQIASERKITIGSVTLDYDSLSVTRGSSVQTLPRKDFTFCTSSCPTRQDIYTLQLMDEIWGTDLKPMTIPLTYISTGCANGSNNIRNSP